jgi:hypothetical protein
MKKKNASSQSDDSDNNKRRRCSDGGVLRCQATFGNATFADEIWKTICKKLEFLNSFRSIVFLKGGKKERENTMKYCTASFTFQ